ncbi:uncharacterized protein LOC111042170 [Myzus persicae]|uniref:uncharacterized protein LOC111042170 n=1 Tax=Myzus persicae TaxID=13164 RepID=UPI000B930823|nr:uncharacterized protein LOC111042170 [Myzus persicae]
MFTFHGLFNNYYVPLVYFLLKDKQTISYSKAFKAIDLECSKLCQDFKIDVIYVDFEVSIHKAIQKIWPETLIKGCRFHLGQSWWRKMQDLGLAKEYGTNGEVGNYLSYIFGLSFLSPDEVGDFFSFELSEIQPVDSKIVDFADYLVNNYISEESLFPPSIWAEKSSSLQRTTNAYVLKIIQTDTVVLVRSSLISIRQYRKQRRNNILFVENQIKKLNENKITRLHFVKSLSNKYKPNF